MITGIELSLYASERLNIYIDFYCRIPSSPAADLLRKSLVALYAHILRFVASAVNTRRQSRASRMVHAIWNADIIQGFERTFEQLCGRVETDASACDRLLMQALVETNVQSLRGLHDIQDSLEQLTNKASSALRKQEHQHILDWASSIPFEEHFRLAESKALSGTGEWLFQDVNFVKWQNSSSSEILWLHGNAGTGKSTVL